MLCKSVWNSERQELEDVTIGYSEVFGGSTDITTIYVPAGSEEEYETAWSTVANKIKAIGSI